MSDRPMPWGEIEPAALARYEAKYGKVKRVRRAGVQCPELTPARPPATVGTRSPRRPVK